MKGIFRSFTYLFIFAFCLLFIAKAGAQDSQLILAKSFYENGKYEEALDLYKQLYQNKTHRYQVLPKLIDTYQQLNRFDEAEKILQNWVQISKSPIFILMLAYNYLLQNQNDLAGKYFKQAELMASQNINFVYLVGKTLEKYGQFNSAIRVFETSKKNFPSKNYSLALTSLYASQGQIDKMLAEYIHYLEYRPESLPVIQKKLLEFVGKNKTHEANLALRKQLLIKIKKTPLVPYYQLLSWLFVIEKDYPKAFAQEKAILKRNPNNLHQMYQVAENAYESHFFEDAQKIYQFILKHKPSTYLELKTHRKLILIGLKEVSSKKLQSIDQNFQVLFQTYGYNPSTFELQLLYADFLIQYKKQPKLALQWLKQRDQKVLHKSQVEQLKMKIANVLLFQNKFNEALIYYTQVTRQSHDLHLTYKARYMVAKTSYYKGDFDWAEKQLHILKSNTNQLIANDALMLKLLISDHKNEDSLKTALSLYAKADLNAFQKKNKSAIAILDSVLTDKMSNKIIDEALLLQGQLYTQEKQFQKAIQKFERILMEFSNEITADKACYLLAQIFEEQLNNPEKAKEYYEKIIFNYPNSIFFIEARKSYRALKNKPKQI